MLQQEIEWHFNPPLASHMGGSWERLIRSTRTILKALVKEQLLNDEQLLTLMSEVEKILNDRPITPVSDDPNDPSVLTPNMLLLIKVDPCIESLSVNRCFRPKEFQHIKNAQLHLFSDGSELGYGACAYLRLVDGNDKITCSLIIGKARLAPIKQMSIPRLELSGAVTACRLYQILNDELEIKVDNVTFWTDSTIVLGYIRNTSRRFKTFVANRLSIIHNTTSLDQWRHVDSPSNPADIASRGIDACDSKKLNIWLNGPNFLLEDSKYWPQDLCNELQEVTENDAELKKEVAIHAMTNNTTDYLMNYFADWTKLLRATAWLIRFKFYCRQRYLNHQVQCRTGDLTLSELKIASNVILVNVQSTYFKDEIIKLKKDTPVKKDSRIASLNPVLDNELIRAKGRLSTSNHDEYPIILPDNHHVTSLIVRFYHENQGHVGRQQVLAATRMKYWILKGPSLVKKVIGCCIPCKRQHRPLCVQQMAPLLDEQIIADKPPFTFVGIDYFGPLLVKLGRSHVKRYGCLFTCLTTRAVHLEVAHTLTMESFLSAFQRFISRRGVPTKMYSDNGTNLVSGDSELRKSIKEWNQSKIGRHMLQQEIEWHFNPPLASHMGGSWERLIRSTRTILKALVKEQLLTLMSEVEKILNDRPITPVSDDPNDPSVLTPNMLLLMKSNSCIPSGIFKKTDIYARRWWKQVQYLANVFWRRWIREYLPTLQMRPKWQRPNTDIRKGDIVLVAEVNVQRGQWPLGRVTEVKVGRDGHVRSCVVKTHKSELVRPITKLCLLEGSDL